MTFRLYPAMDLIIGKCVRLNQGDFTQMTEYAVTPLEVVETYEQAGAKYLHIVDLDGAKDPSQRQLDVIKAILEKTSLKVQVGGGIRSVQDAQNLKELGVEKIIIGSLAAKDAKLAKEIISSVGAEYITIGIDVFCDESLNTKIAVSGWQATSELTAEDMIDEYSKEGVKQFLCTDISKDGTLTEPNFSLYEKLKNYNDDVHILVSGGVSKLSDIQKAKSMDMGGIIIGKALYENKFSVEEALKC